MKKMLLLLFLCGALTSSGFGQYFLNWASYDYIKAGTDITRSVAYNPITDHVLVATRYFGVPDIIILDAATGDSLGRLDTDNMWNGTYPINMVSVADDGTIYATNLSAPQYTPGSTLMIYRFANETAPMETVADDALDGARYGDSFAAVGTGAGKYLYVSGMGNSNIAVFRDEGGASLIFDSYLPLPVPSAARHGISPVSPGGKVWINGADTGNPAPQLLNSDGTVITVVPDSLASAGGTSCIRHLELGNYKLIVVSNAWGVTVRCVRYFEDELGTVTFDYFGEDSDSTMLFYNGATYNTNFNATASLDYDSKRHAIISLFGYNSVASVSMDSLLKASTPRSDSMTISIDGSNDFFPTDHVGASNGRDMYLTWSEGKVFVGVTGFTLIDPTGKNRMYAVFDLDPDGTNGSATSPEDAGGITAFPFLADVVYMIESWNEPGWMIGTIYKWNGSQWTKTEFDGNMAAQGALAAAAEGGRKLAELAAIKNAPGIGADVRNLGLLVYVAEASPTGQVLAAFPSRNATVTGANFTHYFYADSLGSGMFPADTSDVKIRSGSTGVDDGNDGGVIADYALHQNYPNPFNPSTTIRFGMSKPGLAAIEIYDITGKRVRSLLHKRLNAGLHDVNFSGEGLSSGVYFYRLKIADAIVETRKMLFLK
ncbi:MAG: T9SS type A sorting domain-containing protein [Candidatus Zhuqueibacterota bacterium]